MLAEMNAKSLIFSTDEDGGHNIPCAERRLVYRPISVRWKAYMNRTKKPSCKWGCLSVSKIDRRINPAAPAIAAMMERKDKIFCVREVL